MVSLPQSLWVSSSALEWRDGEWIRGCQVRNVHAICQALAEVPELQREWHRKHQVQSSAKSTGGTQEAVGVAIIIDPGSATYQLADL